MKALNGPNNLAQSDDEIDLRALLGTLIDHKWLIIGVTGAFFVLSLAYVFMATPVYEADVMVQVAQAPSLPGLSAIEQAVGASNPEAADAQSILTSQSVVKRAVDELNLNIVVSPYRVPLLGDLVARQYSPSASDAVNPPWFGLGHYDWGGSHLSVPQLEVPNDLLGKDLTLVTGNDGSYTLLKDDIVPILPGQLLLQGHVGQVATGSGVTILVKALLANPGVQFHVVRNYEMTTIGDLQKAIKITQTGKQDSNVIALSFNSKSPHLAIGVLDQITQAFLAQNMGRNSAQAANGLTFVEGQLSAVKQKLEDSQDALNAFQVKSHSVDVPMQTQSLLTQIDSINVSIQQLETQRVEAARLYTPQHPAYKAVVTQIAQLSAQKSAMQKQLNTLPDIQREMLRLTGNVQVLDTAYTGLLNEAQQLELAQAGTIGNARIVDPPAVDITTPAKPKKLITVLGATFVGAFLSLGLVLVRQMLNRAVEGLAEIRQLGIPVYASIPVSEKERVVSKRIARRHRDHSKRLLALAAPTDLATEALRGLRTSLQFTKHEARNNLVMICGSSPHAGKTFVSANLAAVMSQVGQRVLLIDANMRDGQLHRVFGGRAENGLSELIDGQTDLKEAVRHAKDLEGLDLLSCGKAPRNPSELLMHPMFGALLLHFSTQYDLVVIDSPPILAVTDAAVIGHHVGTSLLVVRYGVTQTDEIELAKERLAQSGVQVDGVIFNAVEKRNADYFAYGYHRYEAV